MTKDTQQLFDAPWEVGVCEKGNPEFESVFIASKTGCLIGRDMEEETANRLVHLPELYDALMETVYYKCFECMGGLRHNIDMTREELVKNGCPKQNKSNVCIYVKHIELLRKVRDGE